MRRGAPPDAKTGATLRESEKMTDPGPSEVTQILAIVSRGDERAADRLLPLIYDELRRLANQRLSKEPAGQGMQATSLVHEAYLRLVGDCGGGNWANRAHFFAAAAEAMRRILVEKARSAARLKHGGGRKRLPLDDAPAANMERPLELLDLDEALQRLEAVDRQMSDVVKLRYFVGLSIDETADALNVAPRTVDRQWIAAKAWLFREIERGGDPPAR